MFRVGSRQVKFQFVFNILHTVSIRRTCSGVGVVVIKWNYEIAVFPTGTSVQLIKDQSRDETFREKEPY